jgi:hypothetical protein
VTITYAAPVVTTQPASQSMVSGTVVFSAAASGSPTPSVQWQFSVDGGTTCLEPLPTQSGYIDFAFPATFSAVQASWMVPTVTCPPGSSNTWTSLWPGIGYGTSIVQDGVFLTCASGSPGYFAWWAIGGDPNITGGQPLAQLLNSAQYPVAPGDAITALVSISGSTWTLQVQDTTKNWTFTFNAPNTSPGLNQGAAAVIVEGNSACYPPTCHGLANFGAVHFTRATAELNGQTGPLAAFSPIADQTTNGSTVLAAAGPFDPTGEDFTDTWYGN